MCERLGEGRGGGSIPVVFLLAEKCRVVQLLGKQRGWSGPPASADSGPGTAADFYDSTWKCFWLRGDLAERRRKKNKKKMEGGMKKKRAPRNAKAAGTEPHYSSFLSHPRAK